MCAYKNAIAKLALYKSRGTKLKPVQRGGLELAGVFADLVATYARPIKHLNSETYKLRRALHKICLLDATAETCPDVGESASLKPGYAPPGSAVEEECLTSFQVLVLCRVPECKAPFRPVRTWTQFGKL